MRTKVISAWRKDGEFKSNNWNDPLLTKIKRRVLELPFYNSEYHVVGKKFRLWHGWFADENYWFIDDLKGDFRYILTWYKSRESVDMFLVQGSEGTKEEAERLLKLLEAVE